MKMTWFLVFALISFSCSNEDNKDFLLLSGSFCKVYKSYNIEPISMRYDTNLKNIKSSDSIEFQMDFFKKTLRDLEQISKENLKKELQIDYDLISYESKLNLERLQLEKKWLEKNVDSISERGLFHQPMGKEWYAYFLKKWVSDDVTPDEIFEFGLNEIERVKNKISDIQTASGKDSITFYKELNQDFFFYTDSLQVEEAFHKAKEKVKKQYVNLFPFTKQIPSVKIERNKKESLKIVPAYYNYGSSTFFYTLFDMPFNKRLVDIFFLHEGLPGHHYQASVNNMLPLSEVRKLEWHSGYREGWSAYVEELGKELGVYQTDYDYLGKWEWDIVRSVRVCIDVGINYYGWTDAKATDFWKSHIPNQDDIIPRELKRMRLQPAQVITYKYGTNQILNWKNKEKQKKDYDDMRFHTKVLENGALPFEVLKKQF